MSKSYKGPLMSTKRRRAKSPLSPLAGVRQVLLIRSLFRVSPSCVLCSLNSLKSVIGSVGSPKRSLAIVCTSVSPNKTSSSRSPARLLKGASVTEQGLHLACGQSNCQQLLGKRALTFKLSVQDTLLSLIQSGN